jgi:hypothetical protein
MPINPQNATTAGVMVGIVDVLIWRHFVPNMADVRTAQPFNTDIESAERTALLVGTFFTLVVAGFARSAEVFAVGGLVLVALDFATKHANAVHPDTGKMAGMDAASQTAPLSDSFPMPDYANAEQ